MRPTETTQHTAVALVGLAVLGVLGWRGSDVSYAVVGVVAALVGGRAAVSFTSSRGAVQVGDPPAQPSTAPNQFPGLAPMAARPADGGE